MIHITLKKSLPVVVLVCIFVFLGRLVTLPNNSVLNSDSQWIWSNAIGSGRSFSKSVNIDKDNEYTKITYENNKVVPNPSDKTVLILSNIGNGKSYGPELTFRNLLETICSLDYSKNSMSLGFMVGDVDEFKNVEKELDAYFSSMGSLRFSKLNQYVRKITLLSAPFIEKEFGKIDREGRHEDNVQRLRRRTIARSRNFLLFHSLDTEQYTFFIDADIIRIPSTEMLRVFINSGKDIIVPRITRGDLVDYDRNSWVGQRTIPSEAQFKAMDENKWDDWDYVPRDEPGRLLHLESFYKESLLKPQDHITRKPDYSIKLDSVGGAILFAKSIVYKQGVTFPPNYIIGTTWNRLEGYDGIETEGICYVARVIGYECYGMPNQVAEHSSD
ncbi:Piso0_003454 [Millerozyma farinosa CBS 7064]|uniref:Piso0_003454 protein n=1 Tax=Pichia sorbitophila (strain ATCC MYA-4447 / BCRC 22081 / CBS 7064 / NBRC 10061 / NRRL Y-12695) TaxID=559304 RepID=G8YJ43_PICSO|nr:Piso0_003454 [Millerozyma farinosa CBS 7064]CCE81103.1 Piso0_003454 [Millerozyma farinosa CBS 7064]